MNKLRLSRTALGRAALALSLTAVALAYVSTQGTPAVMTAVTTRELPVYNVDTQEKKLSISFDAAWGTSRTQGILDILDRYGVKTTFFLVGFWAEKNPDMVREIAARGHEIGNHSATHPHISQLTDAQVREELRKCSDLVASITGKPTTLFRPPYGEYDDGVIRTAREAGYECIQWNVDSLDWKNRGAQDMIRRCTRSVHPGDIVLFHNDSQYILEALPSILEYYQQAGYTIVPISELLLTGETWIDHAGKQHAATPEPAGATSPAPAAT